VRQSWSDRPEVVLDSSVPTLRWIYAKDSRQLMCELSLDATHSVYELRTALVGQRVYQRVEQFGDVMPAILRHDQVEARLVEEGWRLEWYERTAPNLH
jgi:hypothetical protein